MKKEIVISKRIDVINSVLQRWIEAYHVIGDLWYKNNANGSREVAFRLAALVDNGKNDVESINSVIGNDSWTDHKCDFCDLNKDYLWEVDGSGGEYSPALLCFDCMRNACDLINEQEQRNS